jgi:hypothetical protein
MKKYKINNKNIQKKKKKKKKKHKGTQHFRILN